MSKLIKAVLTEPLDKGSQLQKVEVQQLVGKKGPYLQFSFQRGTQVFHENYPVELGMKKLDELTPLFKKVTKKEGEGDIPSHNRTKQHPFPEDKVHPFLQALGVQDKQGKIPYSQRDKFTQINHFITLADPLLQAIPQPKIVDFGCGKGYLTLALHAHLKGKCEIVGVDRKKEVMEKLNGVVKNLGWNNITFVPGDIETFKPPFQTDIVVALHACNTATDMAIEQGIDWGCKGLLVAPCCQQELLPTLKKDDWDPLLKWGAIAEKFASLLTDAYRGEVLTALGYKTDIAEFVDVSHTPKNLLIRAIKKHEPDPEHLDRLKNSPLQLHLLNYLRKK